MPSKPFYSIEEVCAKLGKNADQIKELVRDGSLREFRDAGKIFFKADEVEKLAGGPARSGDSGEILLEPVSEAPAVPDVTSSSGGTSIIGLEPLPEEEEKKEDTVITKSGIGVFDDDELEIDTDPMAETQITSATEDHVSLEGSGSGSGLLDLAREADDTALGADLLDEIWPGEEEAAAEEAPPEPVRKAEAPEPEQEEEVLAVADVGQAVAPIIAPVGDASEGIFGGLMVGGLLLLTLACMAVAGALQGFAYDFISALGQGSTFFIFAGSAVGVALISLLVGWFVGKAMLSPRRR